MTRQTTTSGFTLVEILIFIAIVTFALVGALAVFGPAVRNSADPMIRKQVMNIAEFTLREIMQTSFQNDNTGPNGASPGLGCTPTTAPRCQLNNPIDRINYNDVDDYNGYDQTGVTQTNGVTVVPGLANYRVQIAVVGEEVNGVADTNFKRITVRVSNGREEIALTGYRARFQ